MSNTIYEQDGIKVSEFVGPVGREVDDDVVKVQITSTYSGGFIVMARPYFLRMVAEFAKEVPKVETPEERAQRVVDGAWRKIGGHEIWSWPSLKETIAAEIQAAIEADRKERGG
jgi:hypothetical protein